MKISVLELFQLWSDMSVTKQEICAAAGVSMSALHRLRERHKLPAREQTRHGPKGNDPTKEEIAARAAEVRATWSPEVERQRRVQAARVWRPPAYEYDSRTGVFSY